MYMIYLEEIPNRAVDGIVTYSTQFSRNRQRNQLNPAPCDGVACPRLYTVFHRWRLAVQTGYRRSSASSVITVLVLIGSCVGCRAINSSFLTCLLTTVWPVHVVCYV